MLAWTLEDLDPKTWHALPHIEQWFILRNSAAKLHGGFSVNHSIGSLKAEEFRDVYVLCQQHYCGPFASMAFEGSFAWGQYVREYEVGPEVYSCFMRASERNYWERYVGLSRYDPHAMGELMHAINLIGEAWFPRIKRENTMMSPGNCIPAYTEALSGFSGKNALFIGAFSPMSVSDIWVIRRGLLANRCNMSIVDIQGYLSRATADHYKMPFSIGNGLYLEQSDDSLDLVMTNSLAHHLSESYDIADTVKKRMKLFTEMYRVLSAGGKIVMAEHPLRNTEIAEFESDEHIRLDRESIMRQLRSAGFRNISVTYAKRFRTRRIADNFIRRGGGSIKASQTSTPSEGTNTMFLIEATK